MTAFFVLFLISILTTTAHSQLNEQQTLLTALANNSDIQLLRINNSQDSLSLEQLKTDWLPKVTLKLSPSISSNHNQFFINSPYTDSLLNESSYIRVHQNTENKNLTLTSDAVLNQNFPGGGLLQSSIGSIFTDSLINNTANSRSNIISLSFTQPLLKDAWQFAKPSYNIQLQTLSNLATTLEMKKLLLSSLSQIRNLFWDYYEQNSIAIIHKEDLSRAELFLNIERVKFRNGECSQLDTLSAALQYLTASQSVLDSDILIENTRKNLSLALMLSSDSVSIDMSIDVSIAPLPNPEILITQMKQYNPSLKIFEILHDKITLEKAKSKNDRLPMLDIVGTINHSRSGPKILSRQTDETNAVISCILSYALPTKPLSINQKSLALQEKTNQLNETKFHQDMHVKLDQLGKSWEQELMRIALSEKSCAISRQQLTIAQKEYQLGTINRLVLLDAQKNLVAQETSLIRSKINMKKLQIILDELTGSILNQFNLTILQNN